MHTRHHTLIGSLTVAALLVATGFWAPSGEPPLADAAAATTDGSPFSRSVVHAFPTAEAGFARHLPPVGG